MRRRWLAAATVLVAALSSAAIPAHAAPEQPEPVRLVAIADLELPTAMAFRVGDPTAYVAEQRGRVLAVRDGAVSDQPVLDLTHRITAGGEQGLLGIAFSPDGNRLYVHFTNRAGNAQVEEHPVVVGSDGEVTAVPDRRRVLLRIRDREPNHNGGQLAFGPDGKLYLGMGDGGGAGDLGWGHRPGGNAQSSDSLFGKILRVDTARGGAEICNLGLRNPWRFSFDRQTGDLWIGDVGQSEWDEIDRLEAPQICGWNLGWNRFEGRASYRPGELSDAVEPVAVLSHDDGYCAVIGGYVYRGRAIPGLEGWYLFTDNCEGRIRALEVGADGSVTRANLGATVRSPSSFGEDGDGELYVLSQRDGLFRIEGR